MTGKRVGFGRDFEVSSDEWTLKLVTSDTSRASKALRRAARDVGPANPQAVP
jgi:hypothetical protein